MTSLVQEIKTELSDRFVRAQLGRFARLTVAGFVAELALLGTSHLDGKAFAAAMVGVVETAYRQWAPTVPWAQVAEKLHAADQAVQQAAVSAPEPPVAGGK
ncbi:hypothetical protein ABIA32_002674 [Streptacidiphilus sp. MAP12-20]|uniref:hypothetical protein n=1 Tax=Streptacidiphilus sp. MAP12-20 TaxID=3156299 RepID=UPI0035145EC6